MTTEITTIELPVRTYRTALLLTGNAHRAEAAVCEAIRTASPDCTSEEDLLPGTVMAAVRPRHEDRDQGHALLPAALRPVVALPRTLRHCFVLRVLEGLPTADCARLLELEAPAVKEAVAAAAETLAAWKTKEQAA